MSQITITANTPASFLSMHELVEARHRITQDWKRGKYQDDRTRAMTFAMYLVWE